MAETARTLASTMEPPVLCGAQAAPPATKAGAYRAAAAAADVTQTHAIPAIKSNAFWGLELAKNALPRASLSGSRLLNTLGSFRRSPKALDACAPAHARQFAIGANPCAVPREAGAQLLRYAAMAGIP